MSIASDAVPAARLHSVTAGAGPVVVCLHSSGSSSGQWRRLIESQQAAHRFIAFDFHGHGRSPDFAGDAYELRSESEAVFSSLPPSREPIHLVGHSYGGAVALDLAVRYPGRFASVTVFEPVLFALLDPGSAEFAEITSVGFGDRARRAGRGTRRSRPPRSSTTGTGPARGAASPPSSRSASAPASFPSRGTSKRCSRIRCRSSGCARCACRRSCFLETGRRRRRVP